MSNASGKLSVGHPVDVASGTFFGNWSDVSLPGRIELVWDRYFSTALLNQPASPLGLGWTNRFFMKLKRDLDGYSCIGPDGVENTFWDPDGRVENGEVVRNLSTFSEIQRTEERYMITHWDTEVLPVRQYLFQPSARADVYSLQSIDEVSGLGLDLAYDGVGRLSSIHQRRERRGMSLKYNDHGLIASVGLVIGGVRRRELFRYRYDEFGRLVNATDTAGNSDQFEYDEMHRMIRETRRDGRIYTFGYDDNDRCVLTTALDRCDEKRLRYFNHERRTEVTDSLGHIRQYHWNENGQIEREISPLGAVTTTTYDEYGRVESDIDALGGVVHYTYDEAGNLVELTTPDGATSRSEFNERHLVTRQTNSLDAEWKFAYDAQFRLAMIECPEGLVWRHRWNAIGDLVEVEKTPGGKWSYGYDAYGQLIQMTDWQGAMMRYEYDEKGYLTRLFDPLGVETGYHYDVLGRLISIDLPNGYKILNEYDGDEEEVKTIDPTGGVTTYKYGSYCRLVKSIAPDGGVTQYVWSTEPNQLKAIIDEKGETHKFEYDADGYLVKEVFPSGRTIIYRRNLTGEVVERTNGVGETTRYVHDAMGQIVSAIFFDDTEASFAYDLAGNTLRAANEHCVVSLEHDNTGSRVRESAGPHHIESRYDTLGNRVERQSSLGSKTTYTYDPRGQVASIDLSTSAAIRIERDAKGREVLRHFSNGMVLRQAFDIMDRLVDQILENGPSEGSPPVHRRYDYDALGNVVRTEDARYGSTKFQYDPASRLVERRPETDPGERFAYDASGNIKAVTKTFTLIPPDRAADAPVREPATEYRAIRPGNQVVQKGTTAYEYDADGRITRKIDGASGDGQRVFEYRWNPMGLLAEVVTPSGSSWKYSYDAFGRRIRKQGPGVDIRYVWDGNVIMHELHEGQNHPVTWTFWPSHFTPLAKQVNEQVYYVITDQIGAPRELIDEQGEVAWTAQYTAWGQPDPIDSKATECAIRFQGQWFDAESGLHYNNFRYYDPELGAYISMDPVPLAGGLNGYEYAPNALRWIDPYGLAPTYYPVDSLGRPTGAEVNVGKNDLRSTGTSKPTLDPPGWQAGTHPYHQQRSHLVADTLGGSGSDPRNLVTLTDGSNHPGMSTLEGRIRRHVRKGNRVTLTVTVRYSGKNRRPHSVHMHAVDGRGRVVVDETVMNGRRQITSCC